MGNALRARLARWRINLFPAYRGTGGRVSYIAPDFREVRVELRLKRRTRNLVGTLFGGSLYGAVDPFYMIMLIRALGPAYTVWDKGASVRFLKPGRDTLYARFVLTDEELETIRTLLEREPKIDRTYTVELVDADGVAHARVEKIVHLRRGPMEVEVVPAGRQVLGRS